MFVKIVEPTANHGATVFMSSMYECSSAMFHPASDEMQAQGFDMCLFLLPQRMKLHFKKNPQEGFSGEARTSVYYLNNEGNTIDTVFN